MVIKKLLQGSAIGLAAAVVALILSFSGLLDWFEAATWDWRVRTLAQPGSATPRIRLILLDQSSLDWADREFHLSWPWPRSVYEPVLSFCRRGGARAVALDLIFSEPSDRPDQDQALGAALAATPGAASALFLSREQGLATGWPPRVPHFAARGLADYVLGPAGPSVTMPRASFPVPEVATNATLLGNVYADPDPGAVVRRAFLFQAFDGKFVPSLGLAALLAARPGTDLELHGKALRVAGEEVPLDRNGMAIINYRGPTQTHRAVNIAAVIQSERKLANGQEPTVSPSFVRDAFVFVGSTAPALLDLKATPVAKVYPGVEIHATVLDNLLAGDFMRDAPPAGTVAATVAMALLAGIIGRASTTGWHAALAFLVFLPLPLQCAFLAYRGGYWLPAAVQEVAVGIALVGAVIVNYAVEGRQKRFIKSAFKQYLSPAQVDRLVHDPESLKLGGETRELSILFSDVQGFTSISESLSPQALTALLNQYLTAMTDIVLDEGGTIDKYEGDAIIAFWNAPLDLPDHAIRAVRAALRCNRKLAEIRPHLREQTGKDLFARIGINTGPVVVGNMGSNQRFDYTFLGDAGNLASRLEGINKEFGTYIMISEYTLSQLHDTFPARELSRVRVVGRTEPVTVFEPMFRQDFEARADLIKAFTSALHAYYDGKFEEAKTGFSEISDRDITASIYADLCAHLIQSPPETWDGVWVMTKK